MSGNGCAQVTAEYIRDLLAENAALRRKLKDAVRAKTAAASVEG
jgi:hypothetical protein